MSRGACPPLLRSAAGIGGLSLMPDSSVDRSFLSSSFTYSGEDDAAVVPGTFRGELPPPVAKVGDVVDGSPWAGLCGKVLDLSLACCEGEE